jgi:hypothetical protein
MEFITMDNQDEIDAYEQAKEDLYVAEQAVIDAAVHLSAFGAFHENDGTTTVILGRWQDLQTAIDKWREVGGQTSEERDDAMDMMYGKGTGR